MTAQLGLVLEGGQALDPREGWFGDPGKGELGADATMPPGPFSAGLTRWQGGDNAIHEGPPHTARCGDGRAVAGHVPSRQIAEAIADALNAARPAA